MYPAKKELKNNYRLWVSRKLLMALRKMSEATGLRATTIAIFLIDFVINHKWDDFRMTAIPERILAKGVCKVDIVPETPLERVMYDDVIKFHEKTGINLAWTFNAAIMYAIAINNKKFGYHLGKLFCNIISSIKYDGMVFWRLAEKIKKGKGKDLVIHYNNNRAIVFPKVFYKYSESGYRPRKLRPYEMPERKYKKHMKTKAEKEAEEKLKNNEEK